MLKDTIQSFKKRLLEINNSPDLRYFMNQHIIDIKSNNEVKIAFENRIKFLKASWFPKDKFRQTMLSDLEFDYEIELDKPIDEKSEKIKFEEDFNHDSRCEIYHPRDIVDVSLIKYTENLIEEITYEAIRKILIMFEGNRTEAVKILGISIRTLTKYISQYKALGLIEIDIEKKINKNPSEKTLPKALRKKSKSDENRAFCHSNRYTWKDGLCFDCWRKKEKQKNKSRPMAQCHPNEFEWDNGLCFKCWKNK